MKRIIQIASLSFLLLSKIGFAAEKEEILEEHVVWKKHPISFDLPLGHERILSFEEPVTLMENSLLKGDVSVNINNGSLYLKALRAFEPKRAIIRLNRSGTTVVVDISANEEAMNYATVNVVVDSEAEEQPLEKQDKQDASLNYVSLTRFAIQSLYAPERLLQMPDNVARVAMMTQKTVSLFYGDAVVARPLISWQGGDLFVTAVLIKNTLNKEVSLDPPNLLGNWQTATFFPSNTLSARGAQEDTTTLIVTSDSPFGVALKQGREV